jgi:hypothetical protein
MFFYVLVAIYTTFAQAAIHLDKLLSVVKLDTKSVLLELLLLLLIVRFATKVHLTGNICILQ